MTPDLQLQFMQRMLALGVHPDFHRPALDELGSGHVLIIHRTEGYCHVHSFCPRTPMSIVRAALRLEPLYKSQ